MKLRVKFTKHGALKFIGHLDVMRYFQKAIRRADIDIAYSGGFSPHQIMSFASPLSIGLTSDGEYFDMEVNSVTTQADMLKRLNQTMAEGIEVLEIKMLPEKCGNAMASVAAAGYTVSFRNGYEPAFELAEAISWFMNETQVLYTKHTQKSEITIDLKDGIYELELLENGQIYMLVNASSSGNIKPAMILETMYEHYGAQMGQFDLCIHRTETYLRDQEDQKLKPLGSVGQEF